MLTVEQFLTASDQGTLIELAQSEAQRVQREIWELWLHRQTVIQNTVDRLRACGVDAQVARVLQRKAPTRGILCETWSFDERGTYRHGLDFFSTDPSRQKKKIGVHLHDDALILWHGTYDLLHRDGETGIVVSAEGVDDHEAAHRRDIRHVRAVARREDLRINVRDRDVTLLGRAGIVLHTGTTLTTLAFIAGVDLDKPAEEPRG